MLEDKQMNATSYFILNYLATVLSLEGNHL
jgi:hypothetical protein